MGLASPLKMGVPAGKVIASPTCIFPACLVHFQQPYVEWKSKKERAHTWLLPRLLASSLSQGPEMVGVYGRKHCDIAKTLGGWCGRGTLRRPP